MHIEIAEGISSVLIVEDEMIVAMLMEDLVRELGVPDVYLCADAASALETIHSKSVDLAILDIRVRDGNTMQVADVLAERAIPFLFSTGSDLAALKGVHAVRPRIGKPFLDDDFKLIALDTWRLARSGRSLDGPAAPRHRNPGQRVATFGATD